MKYEQCPSEGPALQAKAEVVQWQNDSEHGLYLKWNCTRNCRFIPSL